MSFTRPVSGKRSHGLVGSEIEINVKFGISVTDNLRYDCLLSKLLGCINNNGSRPAEKRRRKLCFSLG